MLPGVLAGTVGQSPNTDGNCRDGQGPQHRDPSAARKSKLMWGGFRREEERRLGAFPHEREKPLLQRQEKFWGSMHLRGLSCGRIGG